MIVKTAGYEVRPEALDARLTAIEAFVAVDEAERIHGASDAVKRFTEVLYPNTLAPVEFVAWEAFAMVDRTA